jgi:hypothetical protein
LAGKKADAALKDALTPQLGFDMEVDHGEQRNLAGEVIAIKGAAPKLTDKFVVPPFTVLDTRAGYWKERRDQWLSIGLRSELGRDKGLMMNSGVNGDPKFYTRKAEVEAELGREISTKEFRTKYYDREKEMEGASGSLKTGTSVFDPLLCEIIVRWFSAPGLKVLDPFAGGAVRGVVSGALGREYTGVELRPEQVEDNRKQAEEILSGAFDFGRTPAAPTWHEGDATSLRSMGLDKANLVMTCPPYADLEVYSDDPRDLSTAPYSTFRAMLRSAMAQSTDLLVKDAFSVWVLGEVRNKKTGFAYGVMKDAIQAAQDCGMHLYNEAILLGSVGTAMLRAAKHVNASRKLERCHQHVLVFAKGDPKKASEACGNPEVEA